MCPCGIPNKASWYLLLIIGKDGEDTTYVDVYLCDEHLPTEDNYASILEFDGHKSWQILEATLSELDRSNPERGDI